MWNIDSLHLTTALLLVLTASDQVHCGRVLVIGASASYSHQVLFHGLSSALHKRGHEVVLVTANPTKDPLTNYTEIDLSIVYETRKKYALNKIALNFRRIPMLDVYTVVYDMLSTITENFYENPEVRKLYAANSKEKFDVVIVDGLAGYGIFALAYKLNAPLIVGISEVPQLYHQFSYAAPVLPSHPSSWEYALGTGTKLSLWTRVQIYVFTLRVLYQWHELQIKTQQRLAQHYLGDDIPSILDIARNTSLWLVNSDPVLDPVRPLPPNVIPYTGFHIKEEPPALPTEIRDFLGNATNGFIYMSLGTNIKSYLLSPEAMQGIRNTFSKLPYKVLWKIDTNDLPRLKDNVFTNKWFPQQAVLAHPNIKLFIFQGGQQSTEEAVHNGVPTVGIPVIFDQMYRIQRLEELGVCRGLDFDKINEETFYEAVTDVLNNKRYKTNMLKLNEEMKDKPYDTKEHAIWWVEYVMRHKGAPHLRFSGVNDTWYQRYDTDVVALLSAISIAAAAVCAIILVQIIRYSRKYRFLLCRAEQVRSTHTDKKVE